MEGDQSQHKKFVCKFCNRRFQCGKSLGGHIRTHLNKKPTREKEQEVVVVEEDEFARVTRTAKLLTLDSGPEGQSGYRLRENPKKSWRFSDHKVPSFQLQQMKVCKECGKGFMSLKALCGHMACHLGDKERKLEEIEEFSETSEKHKLVMDSQSDTETSSAPTKQRRVSKRLRESSNFEVHGGCSSGSGVEQEQQEVAISLMMLSRDSGYKGSLNSFGESSDNNSVILEGKSSSIDMRISTKRGLSYGAKVSDVMDLKRAREKKLKYEEVTVSDNSDSGYYIHEPKKVESDVSVDGFVRNGEFKKYRAEFGSGFGGYETYDVKSRRGFGIKSEMVKELPKEETYEQVDRSSSKYALRKSIKNGFHRPFTSGSSSVEVYKNVKKSSKYECLTCNKTFHSHRALGDHRTSHTKSNGYSESMYESGENSIDSDESPIPTPQSKLVEDNKPYKGKTPINQDLGAKRNSGSKRSKGYECPFCFKVFKSGQALGGHKRSHFVGGCEVKTVVLGQEHQQQEHEEEEEEEEEDEEEEHELEVPENEADIPTLFDLNLPAPMEEEATGSFEYMSW
ncbi:hypothetical protein ACLB2K_039161 [Fragaria x ananassa]